MEQEDNISKNTLEQAKLLKRKEVIQVIEDLFLQEHITLRSHPKNEQTLLGAKLVVLEIELKKLIKELAVVENNSSRESVKVENKTKQECNS